MPWPKGLKDLMKSLSIFNINIELARPECSIKWTASSKMDVVLAVPFLMAFLILCCECTCGRPDSRSRCCNTITIGTALAQCLCACCAACVIMQMGRQVGFSTAKIQGQIQ